MFEPRYESTQMSQLDYVTVPSKSLSDELNKHPVFQLLLSSLTFLLAIL